MASERGKQQDDIPKIYSDETLVQWLREVAPLLVSARMQEVMVQAANRLELLYKKDLANQNKVAI